jgi:RNA polymerase sigma factor (sigma-70 family)
MEVSALKFSGGVGLHGRSPLLRLQSDERLVALIRRGSTPAFEVLVDRYEGRLLAFCRHLLGSREDAEDVLQDVFSAAYKALLADDRAINLRPWLYRIARNRSLNQLRRTTAVGVDSMDIHLSDFGASTADEVHRREDFRLLVTDIRALPETQRTALVLREMDALSYEQIAEAMETTVPSVKSLLVRARVSLAEAAEARLLTCDEVRDELGEIAEGLRRRPSPPVRRHLRTCQRCEAFRGQLKETNKALAALLPLGPLVLLKKLALSQLGHHAGSGAAAGSSAGAAGGAAAGGLFAGSGTIISAGIGAVATKAAAGLAAAALLTAGAVAIDHGTSHRRHPAGRNLAVAATPALTPTSGSHAATVTGHSTATVGAAAVAQGHKLARPAAGVAAHRRHHHAKATTTTAATRTTAATTSTSAATTTGTTSTATTTTTHAPAPTTPVTPTTATSPTITGSGPSSATPTTATTTPAPAPGRTETQTEPTVLPAPPQATNEGTTPPAAPGSFGS